MISNQKELYTFLDKVLAPYGYKRKVDAWYLENKECICFISVVKSDYSGRYSDSIGAFAKGALETVEKYPKCFKGHLKYNIGDIAENDSTEKAFDLENKDFVAMEREQLLKQLIEKYAIPFLEDVSTEEGIRIALNKYKGLPNRTKLSLKKYLGIPVEE